jgi:hypothetical protein
MYWDLDDLLETVIAAQGKYTELDLIIREVQFWQSKTPQIHEAKGQERNALRGAYLRPSL